MKFLLGSLISLLLAFSPVSQKAEAASCKNAGPRETNISLGSQVDGRLFTICADSAKVVTLTKSKSSTPPKPNQKVNPTGQVIFSYRKVGDSTRVTFRPVKPKAILVSRGALAVGQQVDFAIDKSIRLGANWVFGRKLGVRFTPIAIAVAINDATTDTVFEPVHTFAAAGTYRLTSLVTYRVEYRTLRWNEVVNRAKANWVLEPDTITLASNAVTVTIGDKSNVKVVLVSE